MGDVTAPRIRERVWVTKYDHSTDPPTPVEEVFVENGVVRSVRTLGRDQPQEEGRTNGGRTET